MFKFLSVFLIAALAYGGESDKDLDLLVKRMTGTFSSQAQAEADERFYNIHLDMSPIWQDRTDGHWLYVEQAVATSMDKPYRQRVYRVYRAEDGRFCSEVFSLPNPEKYIGAQHGDKPLADLSPEKLSVREGCAVYLTRNGNKFEGGTHEKDCSSNLRGATYATSDITVLTDRLVTLDRGWDGEDKQVWGSEYGGYIFIRTSK